jgi:hypothetical protein
MCNLFPCETTLLLPMELDPFPLPFNVFSPPVRSLVSFPYERPRSSSNKICLLWFRFPTRFRVSHSHLHHKHYWHLRSKIGYSVFKSLHPVQTMISSSSFRMKKLKRGICHTPIFDLRSRSFAFFYIFCPEYFLLFQTKFRQRGILKYLILWFLVQMFLSFLF